MTKTEADVLRAAMAAYFEKASGYGSEDFYLRSIKVTGVSSKKQMSLIKACAAHAKAMKGKK
jgi:hypothetical protein